MAFEPYDTPDFDLYHNDDTGDGIEHDEFPRPMTDRVWSSIQGLREDARAVLRQIEEIGVLKIDR